MPISHPVQKAARSGGTCWWLWCLTPWLSRRMLRCISRAMVWATDLLVNLDEDIAMAASLAMGTGTVTGVLFQV
jgi:hypothetical protein